MVFFNNKGMTLIELLIVVLIIGILASIIVPSYLGFQERSRRGAVTRAAIAAEADISGWLQSAVKGGTLTEVDSNGDGTIGINDVNNNTLLSDLSVANQLCQRYINARWSTNSEMSPWNRTNSLWVIGNGTPGAIACSHLPGARTIFINAQSIDGTIFYEKAISVE